MSDWDKGTSVPDPESDPGDGWGVMTVRISHEEFLELKRDGFNQYSVERMACRKLGITRDMSLKRCADKFHYSRQGVCKIIRTYRKKMK